MVASAAVLTGCGTSHSAAPKDGFARAALVGPVALLTRTTKGDGTCYTLVRAEDRDQPFDPNEGSLTCETWNSSTHVNVTTDNADAVMYGVVQPGIRSVEVESASGVSAVQIQDSGFLIPLPTTLVSLTFHASGGRTYQFTKAQLPPSTS